MVSGNSDQEAHPTTEFIPTDEIEKPFAQFTRTGLSSVASGEGDFEDWVRIETS